jgi:hypothetical protein
MRAYLSSLHSNLNIMAQHKANSIQNQLRNELLRNGALVASSSTAQGRTHDREASRALAIAARRSDFATGKAPVVSAAPSHQHPILHLNSKE